LRKIIHLLKYKQKFAIERILALLLDDYQNIDINFCSYDFFIPVPLHRSRLRQRGFNQAVVLGNVLRRKHNMPLQRLAMQRIVATLPQVRLQGKERMENVRNAFKIRDAALVQNKSILLLDDVYTTGATMNECARALRDAGALRVDGFVVARAV
jgi:ComF family protein